MSVFAATATDSGASLPTLVGLGAVLAVTALVVKAIFNRRAKAQVSGAAGDRADSVVVRIAPAPPLPENIARVRELLDVTTPMPAITRYSVPVVTIDATMLVIRDKKLGELVSIPLTDVASVEARSAAIKPKGTLVSRTYPSLWITVEREAGALTFALTPLVGAYDSVPQAQVEALAAELGARLGAPQS